MLCCAYFRMDKKPVCFYTDLTTADKSFFFRLVCIIHRHRWSTVIMIISCCTINYCFPFHRRICMWVIYLAYSIPGILDSERYWFYNEVSFFFLVTLITCWSSKNAEIFNFNKYLFQSRKVNLVGTFWVG